MLQACVGCFFSTPYRVTWSIEGGDEFGYENVMTTHFASAERRLAAGMMGNNRLERSGSKPAAQPERSQMEGHRWIIYP